MIARLVRLVGLLALALAPSRAKVSWLRLRGHEIGSGVRIGVSWLDVRKISLGNGVRIGSFNVFKNLEALDMGEGATIGRYNLFTTHRFFKAQYPDSAGRLLIGRESAITMLHYFAVQHTISLGERTLVAGIHSIFFTHQKGLSNLDEAKPITVGDRVYFGTACRVLPGAHVSGPCVVGAGAVVSGRLDEQFCLYAPPRCTVAKRLPADSPYFVDESATRRKDER